MGSRVENSYKEYIRQGRDIAIALDMAHEDEKIRLRDLNRPPVEIPTYKYVEPYVSEEDRGPDPDELTPRVFTPEEVLEDDSQESEVVEPILEDGFTDKRLPGKVYKTAPALKAALTAL